MKRVLIGLALLPLFTGSALAFAGLSDPQLDEVTAGLTVSLPAGLNCGSCNFSYANSSSDNGVTTSSSGSGSVGVPTGSGGGSGSGSGGGSGSGSGGGSGSGAGGSGTGLSFQVPAAGLAELTSAAVVTVVH